MTFSIQDDPWGSREALVAFWLDIRKSKAFKVDFKLPKKEVHSLCQISDTKVPGRRLAGLGLHRGPEDCDTRPRHRAGRGSSARRTAARSPGGYRKSVEVLARLRHETPSSCRKSETVRVTWFVMSVMAGCVVLIPWTTTSLWSLDFTRFRTLLRGTAGLGS